MRSIEVTAKNVEMAKEKGLQMLGVDESLVIVNVIEKGSMLKKAKIEMMLFETEEEKLEQEKNNKQEKEATTKTVQLNDKVEKTVNREISETEENVINVIKEFLEGLFKLYNISGSVEGKVLNDDLYIKVNGEELGVLIGYHGDTLEALQSIINNIIKNKNLEYRKKIFLDIENYREKREDSLRALAQKMASKVLSIKKSLKLEPMNSYERRIIHECLCGIDHISTHSEGDEPNRYLIIDYVA